VVNGQLHAPASSSPGKEPELGRPRGGLKAMGKTKVVLPLPGIEPTFLGRPDYILVVIPTKRFSG
jgi:hypothetical protein